MDKELQQLIHIIFSMRIKPSRYIEVYRKEGNSTAKACRYLLENDPGPMKLQMGWDKYDRHKKDRTYEDILEDLLKGKFRAIYIGGPGYPAELENIYLPPPVLFCRGQGALDGFNIAVVGSRKCTRYGRDAASYISKNLSKTGITIVSGLALGIDSEAHKTAVRNNGKSIAVLGNGPDIIYPPENRKLYGELIESGTAVTEFPPGMPPLRKNFPVRNRIISGISRGVVIVEAGRRSGAMITGMTALDQGREVFAVPGSIFSSNSSGCHRLIKNGAKLVDNIDDILEEFQGLFRDDNKTSKNIFKKPRKSEQAAVSGKAGKVYKHISCRTISLEELILKCRMPAGDILNALTVLEMENLVKEEPSNHYSRCD